MLKSTAKIVAPALFFCCAFSMEATVAAQLLGVELKGATRQELHAAINNKLLEVGALKRGEVVAKKNNDPWFDAYPSEKIMPGSHRLYVGYVKDTQTFAFAEYEFLGNVLDRWSAKLTQKYGQPQKQEGKYWDHQDKFLWMSEGVAITLYFDWVNQKTRIEYKDEEAMAIMQEERMRFGEDAY